MLELVLDGLHCAHCSQKIENKINNQSYIKNASINFATKTLNIEFENDKIDENNLIEQIKKLVNNIEPDVNVQKKHTENIKNNFSIFNILAKNIISILGLVLFLITIFLTLEPNLKLILYLSSYLLIGYKILIKSLKNISKGQIFDENFLMAIATIGALFLQEYVEAISVMIFYQIGEMFQDYAVDNSRKNITDLLNIKSPYAHLKIGDKIKTISPEDVKVGDIIMIKPGEKIPLDGIVIEGNSLVDTKSITGESVPVDISKGNKVYSGCINQNSTLLIKTTTNFKNSTVSKILNLVENASSKKAPTENFITTFSKYYTPAVVISALILAFIPPLVTNTPISGWLSRALIFLVVSCPCALVISIPLGFFGGIGKASKHGILIKGSNYLEALNSLDTIVFDKTGTLTKGVFKVTKIVPSEGFTKEELLKHAVEAEVYSNHPIAKSITNAYSTEFNGDLKQTSNSTYEEKSGYGIIVKNSKDTLAVGNNKLMKYFNINYNKNAFDGTIVHVALNNKYVGYIVISDELKEQSINAIRNIKNTSIKNTIMLTGDLKQTAINIGNRLGIDKVYYELLPQQKVNKFEEIKKHVSKKLKVAFVGDGINDAPVLAMSDVGIAMGGLGSDAAIEASDIVLMNDDPNKIYEAISIAKYTKKIIIQNIIFALGVKFLVLFLSVFGLTNMWAAIFADVGVALLAILNVTRIIRKK